MKLFLKVLKITLIALLVLLSTLAIAGWLLQDRITNYALKELSKTFDAPLGTENISFSLIKDFPLASIQFEGLWLGAYEWNENKEIQSIDTLARINNLFVSVNALDIIDNVFTIRAVELQDGYVKYEIDTAGVSNFDFLMASDSTAVEPTIEEESDPLDLTAEGIALSNFTFKYKDAQQMMEAKVYIPSVEGAVKLKDPKTFAHFEGDIKISNLIYQDMPVDRLKSADTQIDLTFKTDTLELASLNIHTPELDLSSNGKIILGEEIFTDLTTEISIPSIASVTKYAPNDLLSSYGIGQVAGKLNISSKLNGIYSESQMPHYDVSIRLSDGSVKYENYPLVYNIGLNTDLTNGSKNSDITTSVKLKKLSADLSGNHLNVNGEFSNLNKLRYNVQSQLQLDLNASRALIPDSIAQKIGGRINLEIATKGVTPDSVDSEFVKSLMKNTKASMTFDQFDLVIKETINLKNFSSTINYSEKTIDIKGLNANFPEYKIALINNSYKIKIIGDPLVPEKMNINIPKFHIGLKEGTIDGSAKLRKMKNLEFTTHSKLDINLSKIKRFVSDTLVNDMSGQILAAIQSKGKLNIDKMDDAAIEAIMYDQTNFDLTFKNINLDMKDSLMNVNLLSGKVTKDNHLITIKDFKGDYQGMAFNIESTKIENVFNTALRNKPGTLKVDGVYRFGDLDYKALMAFAGGEETEESTPSKETTEPTNWNYQIKGQVFVNSFKYENSLVEGIETVYNIDDKTNLLNGNVKVAKTDYDSTIVNQLTTKFVMDMKTNEIKGKLAIKDVKYLDALLTDISALYNVNDTIYTIDQLKLKGFGGSTNSSFKVHMIDEDEMEVEMKSTIDELNVRTLMKEMRNFDQEEMKYEQLNGIVSSDNFFLRMKMIEDSVIYDDLRMTCDLKFRDGGIYHYPPVQDMAQFIPKIDKLDTMSFKTINTHMFLFKDAVYVPRTYVVSNIFDVEAIGMQSFGEDYQYHIGVSLYQLLGKKDKVDTSKDGPTDRKKMIRLKATGRKGKYKNGFDKEKERDAMVLKVKTQEKILEFRFQPQFFNFDTKAENI